MLGKDKKKILNNSSSTNRQEGVVAHDVIPASAKCQTGLAHDRSLDTLDYVILMYPECVYNK